MKPLLPLVNAEIGFPLAQSLDETCEKKQWRKIMEHIEKFNPVVAEFIERWSKLANGMNATVHSAVCGILVYKLLESQAEADRMSEDLDFD